MRKDKERERITAQLLDADTGHHVWVEINPSHIHSRVALAAAYGFLNRKEEAQAAVKEILKTYPKFSIDAFVKKFSVQNPRISIQK